MLKFTVHMIDRENLQRLKKLVESGKTRLSLAKTLLCYIAFGEELPPSVQNKQKTTQAFSGLRRYKFIRRTADSKKYEITSKGKKRLEFIVIDEIFVEKPKKWDRKWRLIIYDLPIRFKKARDAFRWKLKDLGFLQLQKSAWIYPYPCERELLFVAEFFGVRQHVDILEVNKVLQDKKLKAHFGLQ